MSRAPVVCPCQPPYNNTWNPSYGRCTVNIASTHDSHRLKQAFWTCCKLSVLTRIWFNILLVGQQNWLYWPNISTWIEAEIWTSTNTETENCIFRRGQVHGQVKIFSEFYAMERQRIYPLQIISALNVMARRRIYLCKYFQHYMQRRDDRYTLWRQHWCQRRSLLSSPLLH